MGVMKKMEIYLECKRYREDKEVKGIKIFNYCGGIKFENRNKLKNEL
jgi:hypothetical protein